MRHLKILYQYRDLLWLWTSREIKIRYKQSLLGVAWAILQPLALTAVFTIVFSWLVRIDSGEIPYPIFAYSGLVPWTFFASSMSFGVSSLVNNMNLVTKIYFPREILPLANIGAALVDFAIASLIFLGMMVFYRVWPGIEALWVLPLLIVQIILTVGVTLIGSAVLVFFRDVRFVIPLLIQIWMYSTPVIYPVDLVPDRLLPFYFINPMAGIIDGYRRALFLGQPPRMQAMLLSTVLSVLLCALGYALFKRLEPLYADLI
jgi:lipopolysaccharide transport system permease protein